MRRKLRPALLSAASLLALPLLATGFPLHAQLSNGDAASPALSSRITVPVNDAARVTLRDNVHPLAQARYDRGAAPDSLGTGKLALLLRRSPAQQIALERYLGSLQDPHSPAFHKWLTPQAYGAQFGIGDQDLGIVVSWLKSEGFAVDPVPASRNFIRFAGTAGQLARTFGTGIHTYAVHGVQHFANTTNPQIPAALAPVVAGLSPLNDFRAQPQHLLGSRSTVQSTSHGLQELSRQGVGAKPLLTDPSGSPLYVTPADAATLYDAPNALNLHYSGTGQDTGAGVNIGVAEYSDLQTSNYLNYRKLFLNESAPASPTLVVDGVDPGVLDEGDGQQALIDTEVLAGLAPGANLYVYSSQSDLMEDGLANAIVRAVEDNTVSVLEVSYSTCEAALGASGNLLYSEMWQEAAAQGISVVVATGNTGAASCDDGTENTAISGLAVNGYASTPYTTSVGGTDLDILSTNFAQYVNTAAGQAPYYESLLGYVPENPWNDAISNDPPGIYTSNTAALYNDGSGTPSFTVITAAGGGASSDAYCAAGVDPTTGNCAGTLSGYPAPPYQSSVSSGGAAPTGVRLLPDVAMLAGDNQQHPVGWAFCSDSVVGQANYSFTDCTPATDGTFSVEDVGGTSASSSAFAGVLGLVIQSLGAGTRLGVANNVLYNLHANSSNSGSIFHDVTAGNIAVPCQAGTPSCGANGFLSGYDAGPGYDLASGLGSVDVAALVAAWPTVTFTQSATTLAANGSVAPLTIVHGTPVTLAATVTPSSATGSVAVQGEAGQGGAAVSQYIPLVGGAGTIQANSLPGGSYTIDGYYAGDVSVAPSTSTPPIQITVTPENSALLFSLQIADVNNPTQSYVNYFPYGAYGFAYAHPQSATNGADGTATGTVTLLNGSAALGAQPLNSKGNAAFPLYLLGPGNYSLGASYSGDRSYNPSSTTTGTSITVAKGATQISVTATPSIIPASGSATVTVMLTTDSTGAFPSGGITLTANGQSYVGTVVESLATNNADQEVATFTLDASTLAGGVNTLTASYPGDANYTNSTGTALLTVTGVTAPTPAFTLAGPSAGIALSSTAFSASGALTVTPTNGFTGLVNLTCSVFPGKAANPPTCTVTPSVTLSSGAAASATITIQAVSQPTTAGVTKPALWKPLRSLLTGGSSVGLCALLWWTIPARRRGWRTCLSWRSALVLLAMFGALSVVGCGFTATGNPNGTTAGTFTATVTGTSGSTTASTQVTVTVQ